MAKVMITKVKNQRTPLLEVSETTFCYYRGGGTWRKYFYFLFCFSGMSSKMKYIFRGARYFVIKSNNHENVALAKAKGVWSTPPQNEIRLNNAYKVSDCTLRMLYIIDFQVERRKYGKGVGIKCQKKYSNLNTRVFIKFFSKYSPF